MTLPSPLTERNGIYGVDYRHERLRGGRMAISLRTEDLDRALERWGAIRLLMERGDWGAVDRLRQGELHVTDVVRAVREGDVESLRRVGHSATRLEDACLRYLRRAEGTTTKSRTVDRYQTSVNVLLEEFGEDYPMDKLTAERAERFLHEPKEDATGVTWAPATQRAHRSVYAAIWDLAIEDERERAERAGVAPALRQNPWKRAKLADMERTRHVFLTPEQWADVVEKNQGTPRLAFMAVAALAGLRRDEARYLRPDMDVLLDGAEPMIRVQGRKGRHAWTPKTENSVRDVPVTDSLRTILREHIETGFATEHFMFTAAKSDRPASASTVTRWARESLEAAGIEYGRSGESYTYHSLRHSYASWMAQRGVPLNIVAALLGDTLEVTESTYAHLVPDTLRAAAQVVEHTVKNPANPPAPIYGRL